MTEQRSHLQTGFMSRQELGTDAHTWEDYRTAHNRAGDSGYTAWLPEACITCRQQELSAEEAGVKVTSPDEEWTVDDVT